MKDRIIKFLTQEGITATKFADEIGVQRSSISHILSGRNNPGFDFIQKILSRYKALSAEWLIMGNGNMYKKMVQQDLFSSPVPQPIIQTPPKAIINQPVNDISSSAEGNKKDDPIPSLEISPSKKVEKILIFYSDKTFEEYLLSK